MTETISIPGIGRTWIKPGAYIYVLLGQGPSVSGYGDRQVCVIAPMTSAGTGTANKRVQISTEQAAIDLSGPGSPLHRACKEVLLTNPFGTLWAIPYAASSGAGSASASKQITLATAPTGRGVAELWVCGEQCAYGFTSSDTVTTIAAGLVAQINQKTWLPVTASNSSGVITVTAKIAGASQNLAICLHTTITPNVGTTISAGGDLTGGTDGSTTEATNLAAALAANAMIGAYCFVFSVSDATNVAAIKTWIATRSDPNPGLRSYALVGNRDTYANLSAIAIGANTERFEFVWQQDSEWMPGQLAGHMAGHYTRKENEYPAYNFSGYADDRYSIPKTFNEANWPSASTINDALMAGITPIASSDGGSSLVKRCTSASKTAAGGSVNDWRKLPSHRRNVMDAIAASISQLWNTEFAGKTLLPDAVLPNGQVNSSVYTSKRSIRPSMFKARVKRILRQAYEDGWIQDPTPAIDSMICQVSSVMPDRIEFGLDLQAVLLADQLVARLTENSPG